ncbi:MAG: flagellar hook-basal body protein [bacterium]
MIKQSAREVVMLRGIYIAGSGMTERAADLEVVANNIANMQTDTFKRDRVAYSEFKEMYLNRIQLNEKKEGVGKLAMGSFISTSRFTDFSQGQLVATTQDHDVAMDGQGFIKVELPAGDILYTRCASWESTKDGIMVDKKGNAILDDGGSTIQLEKIGDVMINDSGEILQNGKTIAKMGVYEFDDMSLLEKEGDSLYRLNGDPAILEKEAANTFLRQGYVEKANFSPLSVVTDMITILRDYESSQKVLQSYDETLDEAITKLGRTQ